MLPFPSQDGDSTLSSEAQGPVRSRCFCKGHINKSVGSTQTQFHCRGAVSSWGCGRAIQCSAYSGFRLCGLTVASQRPHKARSDTHTGVRLAFAMGLLQKSRREVWNPKLNRQPEASLKLSLLPVSQNSGLQGKISFGQGSPYTVCKVLYSTYYLLNTKGQRFTSNINSIREEESLDLVIIIITPRTTLWKTKSLNSLKWKIWDSVPSHHSGSFLFSEECAVQRITLIIAGQRLLNSPGRSQSYLMILQSAFPYTPVSPRVLS